MDSKKYTSQRADIETSSENYAKRFSGEAGKYFLDTQKKITLKFLENLNNSTILDVGGGHAQLVVPLVENGFKVTVVGSSSECKKRLDDLLKPNTFDFDTADLLNLPYPEKSFDIVMAFRLLPHEDNWQIQINELCRVAQNGVIIDYPDIRSFNSLYNALFSLKKKVEVNTRQFLTFNRSQISEQFKKNGFSQVIFKPQFFFPMVVHRALKSYKISYLLESFTSLIGLNRILGTPIIVFAKRT